MPPSLEELFLGDEYEKSKFSGLFLGDEYGGKNKFSGGIPTANIVVEVVSDTLRILRIQNCYWLFSYVWC